MVCLVRGRSLNGTLQRVRIVRGDIRDQTQLENILRQHPGATLFHRAAQAIISAANRNPASSWTKILRARLAGSLSAQPEREADHRGLVGQDLCRCGRPSLCLRYAIARQHRRFQLHPCGGTNRSVCEEIHPDAIPGPVRCPRLWAYRKIQMRCCDGWQSTEPW